MKGIYKILTVIILLASPGLSNKPEKGKKIHPVVSQKDPTVIPQSTINTVLDSVKSDFIDKSLEKKNTLPEIKNKNYELWIRRISRAKTYPEYEKYAEGFKNLVTRFRRRFKKCVSPPPPTFHPVYKSKIASECQNGYESGWNEGRKFAENGKKNGGFDKEGNKLSDLLKTMPVDFSKVYEVCRNSGAEEGYKKWQKLLTSPKAMEKFIKKNEIREKMMQERMKYYQRLEEMLPPL